jgi:hypothetical protein
MEKFSVFKKYVVSVYSGCKRLFLSYAVSNTNEPVKGVQYDLQVWMSALKQVNRL